MKTGKNNVVQGVVQSTQSKLLSYVCFWLTFPFYSELISQFNGNPPEVPNLALPIEVFSLLSTVHVFTSCRRLFQYLPEVVEAVEVQGVQKAQGAQGVQKTQMRALTKAKRW